MTACVHGPGCMFVFVCGFNRYRLYVIYFLLNVSFVALKSLKSHLCIPTDLAALEPNCPLWVDSVCGLLLFFLQSLTNGNKNAYRNQSGRFHWWEKCACARCCCEDILAGLNESKVQFEIKGKSLGSSWRYKYRNVCVCACVGGKELLLKYLNAVWHVCDL